MTETYQPTEADLAFTRNLLTYANDGATWGVPRSGQTFRINKKQKRLELIDGPDTDPKASFETYKTIFAQFGYEVIDARKIAVQ